MGLLRRLLSRLAIAGTAQPSGLLARNEPCRCGSGRKYKRCCLPHEQTLRRIRQSQEQGARLNRAAPVSATGATRFRP